MCNVKFVANATSLGQTNFQQTIREENVLYFYLLNCNAYLGEITVQYWTLHITHKQMNSFQMFSFLIEYSIFCDVKILVAFVFRESWRWTSQFWIHSSALDFYCSLWSMAHIHFLVVCELDMSSLSTSSQKLSLSFEHLQRVTHFLEHYLSLSFCCCCCCCSYSTEWCFIVLSQRFLSQKWFGRVLQFIIGKCCPLMVISLFLIVDKVQKSHNSQMSVLFENRRAPSYRHDHLLWHIYYKSNDFLWNFIIDCKRMGHHNRSFRKT